MNREIDEVNEYVNESDTGINVVFKAGFLACIKAVEDTQNFELAEKLKIVLRGK